MLSMMCSLEHPNMSRSCRDLSRPHATACLDRMVAGSCMGSPTASIRSGLAWNGTHISGSVAAAASSTNRSSTFPARFNADVPAVDSVQKMTSAVHRSSSVARDPSAPLSCSSREPAASLASAMANIRSISSSPPPPLLSPSPTTSRDRTSSAAAPDAPQSADRRGTLRSSLRRRDRARERRVLPAFPPPSDESRLFFNASRRDRTSSSTASIHVYANILRRADSGADDEEEARDDFDPPR
mmetsp:Transcript_37458/g.112345  ORF Transcript_37458/g.112345 Transcript_37458/m.112345 type:complete len:241 (+) Transcript_37458:1172-1894(+)